MYNRTPLCLVAKRLLRGCLDAVERRVFQAPDLDAVARGWVVTRPRPFTRQYRDPRWDRERTAPVRDGRP